MDGYDMLILSAYIVTVLLLITLADFNLTVAVKVNSCTYSPIVFTALTFFAQSVLFLDGLAGHSNLCCRLQGLRGQP